MDIVKPFFFFTDPHKDDLMELFIDADIQHFTEENKVRNLYNASFFSFIFSDIGNLSS